MLRKQTYRRKGNRSACPQPDCDGIASFHKECNLEVLTLFGRVSVARQWREAQEQELQAWGPWKLLEALEAWDYGRKEGAGRSVAVLP